MGTQRRIWGVLLSSALFVAAPARAHFTLVAPESWMSQGALGDPQKVGPCGNEGGGTPTGALTTFRAGETIAVTIDERIHHPGHYRVALAIEDRGELPPPPAVTAVGGDPCGSAAIQDPPRFPILADNVLPHTAPFDGAQTFNVVLPADVTCSRCTLQVIEYMASHGQPCFYYHCADIAIVAAPTPTPTATPALCAGDCDANGAVTVDDLVTLVRVALEQGAIGSCAAGDADGDLRIAVNEVVAAVTRALSGCAPPVP